MTRRKKKRTKNGGASQSDRERRDTRGRFGKGNRAAHGHGRPKLPEEYVDAIAKMEPDALAAIDEIIADRVHPHRRQAAEYIINRRRGKPTERTEISAPGGKPLIPRGPSAVLEALRKLVTPQAPQAPPAAPPAPDATAPAEPTEPKGP